MTAESSTPEQAKTATAEKPAEPPFTTDVLTSCTSRFTRKAWDIFLAYKSDLELIQKCPIRAKLTAHTEEGAKEIAEILKNEGHQTQLTLRGKEIELTAPFAIIQLVIKRPQTAKFDAIKI